MKICSVPDYRGALIQVGAAVMVLSWGGGRPGATLPVAAAPDGGQSRVGLALWLPLRGGWGAPMLVRQTHGTVLRKSTVLPNQQLLVGRLF